MCERCGMAPFETAQVHRESTGRQSTRTSSSCRCEIRSDARFPMNRRELGGGLRSRLRGSRRSRSVAAAAAPPPPPSRSLPFFRESRESRRSCFPTGGFIFGVPGRGASVLCGVFLEFGAPGGGGGSEPGTGGGGWVSVVAVVAVALASPSTAAVVPAVSMKNGIVAPSPCKACTMGGMSDG